MTDTPQTTESLSHADLCRLSQCFNMAGDLWHPQDQRINEWLKEQIDLAARELTECQASMFDGECVHPRCPADWKSIKEGADPSIQCPLPWHRSRDGEDDA
jgi:hypothetical protein